MLKIQGRHHSAHRRTDGGTDRRTRWNQYNPSQLRWRGAYNYQNWDRISLRSRIHKIKGALGCRLWIFVRKLTALYRTTMYLHKNAVVTLPSKCLFEIKGSLLGNLWAECVLGYVNKHHARIARPDVYKAEKQVIFVALGRICVAVVDDRNWQISLHMMTSSNENPRYWPFVRGIHRSQRPVTQSFDVFFDLRLNKRLSKQWWDWGFEMPSRP